LIAVDWGTSNFRAFRLDKDGKILERRFHPGGILRVEGGRFAEMLLAQVGDWLDDGEDRILLCGMIGSRQGWIEASYIPCPARIADIAAAVVRAPFERADVLLVPGVIGKDRSGVPEVMRGEETEAFGMMELCGPDGLICLPGTHSKWIQMRDSAIASFNTWMTGEVFAALRNGTILGRLMTSEGAVDNDTFLRGVNRSAETGGILHHLFGVRTLGLLHHLEEQNAASYLSGLLIGHEVRAAMPAGTHVHLAGATQVRSLYALAIEACGGFCAIEEGDVAVRGLTAIGRKLSWI
jgi:2-dehydro-3-deoxygalactonokinase